MVENHHIVTESSAALTPPRSVSEWLLSHPLPGLLVAYALTTFGALARLPSQPEHELHLFLADHYAKNFFELWNTGWYGGFEMTTHPPLAHQLVGLLARLPLSSSTSLGVERAYALWVIAAGILTVSGAVIISYRVAGLEAAGRASWLVATSPLIWMYLFPLGQLPFMLALGLALVAASCALIDRPRSWGAFSALSIAALCCHTSAFALVPLATLGVLIFHRWKTGRVPVKALALSGAAIVVLAGVALAPFIINALQGEFRSVALEKKIFGRPELVICTVLVGALGVLSIVWAEAKVSRFFVGLAALCLPLTVVTPGARDKLFVVISVLLMLGFSCVSLNVLRARVTCGVIAVMSLLSAAVLGPPPDEVSRHHRTAMREVASAMSQAGSEKYRYVTLGMGPERYELGRRVRATTIDGGLPWLASTALQGTPYPSFDELPLGEEGGLTAFRSMLERAAQTGLRWVISSDLRSNRVLEENGYVLRSAFKQYVFLWEKESVAQVTIDQRSVKSLAWSLVPMLAFVAGALSVLARGVGRVLRSEQPTAAEALP